MFFVHWWSIPAVIGALDWLGADVEWVPVDHRGRCSVHEFSHRLRPDTATCILMAAQNEIGNIYPVCRLVSAVSPVPVFCDAAGFGSYPIECRAFWVSAMSFSAHKIGGQRAWSPLDEGGHRDRNLFFGEAARAGAARGTENVVGIAGFGGGIDSLNRRLVRPASAGGSKRYD